LDNQKVVYIYVCYVNPRRKFTLGTLGESCQKYI